MNSLQGRVAIVTGGSSGIGLSIAEHLLKSGCKVMVCSRSQEKLLKAKKKILTSTNQNLQNNFAVKKCDVKEPDSVNSVLKETSARFNNIDIVINSAGVAFIDSIENLSFEKWKEMIDVNLTGVFNFSALSIPFLKKNSYSDIINMGSRSGRYAFAGGTGYNATKFGLQGFSEALFLDLQQYNIRVSLIAPGTVNTGFGGTEPLDWHLDSNDVAESIITALSMHKRANLNMIELRPSTKKNKNDE